MPLLVAVDGNSLAHRAYFAYAQADLRDASGEPVGLLYGFAALLAGVITQVRERWGEATHIVVGLDDPTRSTRKEAWPAYKATRAVKEPALRAQLDRLAALCADLGLAVACPPGGEADDVLAAAARLGRSGAARVVLATSDRDALGQAHGGVEVLLLGNGQSQWAWIDDAAVEARYGVSAARYGEYAALRGDSSDNLPGVAGVGPKRAAQLVAGCAHVRTLLDGAPCGLGARVDQALAQGRAEVERNLSLMAPDESVSVVLDDTALDASGLDVSALAEVGRRWQIGGAVARLARALSLSSEASGHSQGPSRGPDPRPAKARVSLDQETLPLFAAGT